MQSITKPTRINKSKRKRPAGTREVWLKFSVALLATVVLLLGLLVFTIYLGLFGKVPAVAELERIQTPLASEVFSSDGKLLGRYYVENRSYVSFDEISPNVIQALVATEDERFFKHRGIDEVALLRVFFRTILMRDKSAGGGSTLSQQIAKNLFPRNDHWILTIPVNKIREAIIAYRLERIYTKEEILTLYLNTVPFGENIFGIEVASERFFNKRPSELKVPEAAVLIGNLKANHLFNPRLHPGKSVERRNQVIDRMVGQKFITTVEGDLYKASPLDLEYRLITYDQGPAPYFLEYLRPTLIRWCMEHTREDGKPYDLYTDGLRIHTTLDSRLQQYAITAVRERMKDLQAVFDKHWENRDPWGDNASVLSRAVRRTERYHRGLRNGKSHEEIMKEFSQPVEAGIFTWEGIRATRITPLDSVKHYLSMLNAGMVVLENETGAIKAWVGGNDFRYFKFDYCSAARQTGSTFKPFVYLAALESGYSPWDYFSGDQQTYEEYDGWSPGNASGGYAGYYSMKTGLAKSINTVTVDVLMQTGINNTIRVARNLGIKADLPEVPSLALGVASVPLVEMVAAYGSIANGGKALKPYALLEIESSRGKQLGSFDIPVPGKAKVDPENCRVLIQMLQAAIDEGTGRAIRSKHKITGDFAGKTGTTQEFADGWFIGFNPSLTAGCWVGADDPAIHFRNLTYGQGSYMALPAVGEFFSTLSKNPDFAPLCDLHFQSPDSLTIQRMQEAPDYLEKIEERDPGLFDFLKRKEGKLESQGDQRLKNRKDGDSLTVDPVPVWEKIKDAFKKK